MARVVWDRRADIQAAKKLIPFKPRGSLEDFRPPAQIESDFRRLLEHDVPHVNFTFELIENWYEERDMKPEEFEALTEDKVFQLIGWGYHRIRTYDDNGNTVYYDINQETGEITPNTEYEPVYIRGQQTPIDWKSKIGNSDMSANFKTSYETDINKGDIVVRDDGMLYMLNWNITTHANNQATQSVECNAIVDFEREFQDVVDPNTGYLIEEGGWKVIAPGMPISHSEYAGRPDYSGSSGQAGMHPDHLISVYLQWNPTTKKIRLDDRFVMGAFTYKVINVSLAEVQIDKDYGVLTLNCKRVAGGTVSGDE